VGGIRNWDYRFCWLRDTTFNLLGLMHCGYTEDAKAWLAWLSRSVQGDPQSLKIMYGITGKREHSGWTAGWLAGYQGSKPVHIGNKASDQLQLDTFGEVLDALYRARRHGIYPLDDRSGQALEVPLLEHLEKIWEDPGEGLWEVRSGSHRFTESKVMAWVAFDRGIRMVEKFGMEGPVERWRKLKEKIHAQVCKRGFHKGLNSFTQTYGTKNLDASLLLMPLVGFLPIDDPRIAGTVKAVEKHLIRDGLLLRYDTAKVKDGLPAGEGAFIPCNFWLVDVYVLQGRKREARQLFEKLIALSNDLRLLSEEYDSEHGLIGNFPQALSHIGLIDAALSLELGVPARLHDLD
jgi:GH15 family glucan-1,4-alpha-glucosidase